MPSSWCARVLFKALQMPMRWCLIGTICIFQTIWKIRAAQKSSHKVQLMNKWVRAGFWRMRSPAQCWLILMLLVMKIPVSCNMSWKSLAQRRTRASKISQVGLRMLENRVHTTRPQVGRSPGRLHAALSLGMRIRCSGMKVQEQMGSSIKKDYTRKRPCQNSSKGLKKWGKVGVQPISRRDATRQTRLRPGAP